MCVNKRRRRPVQRALPTHTHTRMVTVARARVHRLRDAYLCTNMSINMRANTLAATNNRRANVLSAMALGNVCSRMSRASVCLHMSLWCGVAARTKTAASASNSVRRQNHRRAIIALLAFVFVCVCVYVCCVLLLLLAVCREREGDTHT